MEVRYSGSRNATLVVPASMPISIVTSTSVGERLLNMKCVCDYYIESDVLDEEIARQLHRNVVNLLMTQFRGHESPEASDGELAS